MHNRSARQSIALALLVLQLLATPAFAFSTSPGPADSHGVQLTDPDKKFDDISGSAGGNTMSFGNGFVSGFASDGRAQNQGLPASAATGRQLFDADQPAFIPGPGFMGRR